MLLQILWWTVFATVMLPKKTRALMEHSIFNKKTGDLVCRAITHGLWVNLKTKRLHKFPDEILERMLEGDGTIPNE